MRTSRSHQRLSHLSVPRYTYRNPIEPLLQLVKYKAFPTHKVSRCQTQFQRSSSHDSQPSRSFASNDDSIMLKLNNSISRFPRRNDHQHAGRIYSLPEESTRAFTGKNSIKSGRMIVFSSKDLAPWKCLSVILDDPEQVSSRIC